MQTPFEDTTIGNAAQAGFDDWDRWLCDQTGADSGGARREAPEAAPGGTLSVTRPAQNSLQSASEPRVVLAGVDTLEFGIFVEFHAGWPRIVARLSQLKRAVKGTGGKPIGDGRCVMSPGGRANYPFLLMYAGFQLYLSRKQSPDNQTPNVLVSVNAETLWQIGEQAAVELVLSELQQLAPGSVQECRMSRCDLAADVLIPEGLTDAFLRSHAVMQSRKYQVIGEGDRMQTFYVGAKDSPVQLRIYDKSLEIIQHEKMWFLPLWGLEINAFVWRFEFQLRRPFLKSCGINSLEQLLENRANLWCYLSYGWFSLRQSDNAHVSRCGVHPLWETVQSAMQLLGESTEALKRKRRKPSRDTARLIKQAVALLVGYGTRRKLNSLEVASEEFWRALQQSLNEQEYAQACQRKAVQLGIDLQKDVA